MKKILSLMLMLVVAACMTGCSLHGGHGHGPAAATTTEMTLRTSIPASVFEAPAGNLRGALRAAEANKCTVNFGGIILEHEKYDATNKLHFFAKLVQKALVQAMAKSAEKTKITVQDENKQQVGDIVEVELPADFAEASEEQKSDPQTAAVVIKADENGEITGAKTLSIVQLVEVAKKKIEELVEAFVAVEEKAKTFVDIVVKETEESEGKEITKEKAEENNPVKEDVENGFTAKFYNVTGVQWNYNVDTDSERYHWYKDYCVNQEPPLTPSPEGFIEYLKESAEVFLDANGIKNTNYTKGSEITTGATIQRGNAIMVETSVALFDGDDENPKDNYTSEELARDENIDTKATCKYTSLKGSVTLVKADGSKSEMTINSFKDVMEPKSEQEEDIVHKNGIDIVTAQGKWFIRLKPQITTLGEYTFNITELTLTSKLTKAAPTTDYKVYKLTKPLTFTVKVVANSNEQPLQ